MIYRSVSRMIRLGLAGLLILVCSFSLVSCALFGLAASAGIMKLQFGCLPEGTMIDTPDGPVQVEQLQTGDRVIGYEGRVVVVRQLHQYQEDAAETRHLKVVFEGGAVVQLSPQHRIGGIPAKDLKPGDRVGKSVVASVQPLGGVSRSFDLLTDDAGYRIQGIPVNSMIREMASETGAR